MWQNYYIPTTIDEALELLAQPGARAVAGGTDLVLEIDRGARQVEALIDITRLPGLDMIAVGDDGRLQLGALVTHGQVVASELCVARALPLAQACMEVGAPQIRNSGTVAGNVITASPANDTITPLMALDAEVTLLSRRGRRTAPLRDFYTGVRRTIMAPDELLTTISFAPLAKGERGVFLKLGLRRAQAISVVHVAVVVQFANGAAPLVERARIALGSVAPTIVRAAEAEGGMVGRALDAAVIDEAAALAERAARPIDDLRGPANYRRGMVARLVKRALGMIAAGEERRGWPDQPITLKAGGGAPRSNHSGTTPGPRFLAGGAAVPTAIETTINGATTILRNAHDMTLLDALRDVAGLTGAKKGCAEGECGSCTVWLNGAAVMSCLTPAAQAHGAEVITIEGLERDGGLHPVQQAFIEQGAVQCGYCTPGLIMAAAKLLEERPHPSPAEAQQAISGNLCRCTGYTKVIAAITNCDV